MQLHDARMQGMRFTLADRWRGQFHQLPGQVSVRQRQLRVALEVWLQAHQAPVRRAPGYGKTSGQRASVWVVSIACPPLPKW